MYSDVKTIESAYCVESVVDDVLEVLAHPDLLHQLVLVSVHSGQLANVRKNILESVGQLECVRSGY